jgi:hypothetical protein
MTADTKEIEFVLPSGEFAKLHPPTVVDHFIAIAAKHLLFPALASRCVTLDGQSYTIEQWCAMDFERVAPVFAQIGAFYERATIAGKGVA